MRFTLIVCALLVAVVVAAPTTPGKQASLQPAAAPAAVAPAAKAPAAAPATPAAAPRLAAKRSDTDADTDTNTEHSVEQQAGTEASTEAEAANKWEILKIGAKTGHEGIVLAAMPDDKANLHYDSLKAGVQYNDMPPSNSDDPDDRTSVTDFVAKFKIQNDKANNMVYQSHYGCLQHWHAMTPFAENSGAALTFTNQQVLDQIMEQQKKWWQLAVDHAASRQRMVGEAAAAPAAAATWNAGAAAAWNKADFVLGHMLHTIQDSFAMGHTYRGGEELSNGDGGCGKIYMFQGYGAQDGSLHGGDDSTPDNTKARQFRMWQCSVRYTKQLLEKWAACKAQIANSPSQSIETGKLCSYTANVEPVLTTVYTLADAAKAAVSGLSHEKYLSAKAWESKKTAAKSTEVATELKLTINVNGKATEYSELVNGEARFIGVLSKTNYDPATMPRDICPARTSPKVDTCKANCKPNPNPKWYNSHCICKATPSTIACDLDCATCLGRCAF